MRLLNSKNIIKYEVLIREPKNEYKVYLINPLQGSKLTAYLTNPNVGTHIKINDISGDFVLVRAQDIISVSPVYEQEPLTKILEGMK